MSDCVDFALSYLQDLHDACGTEMLKHDEVVKVCRRLLQDFESGKLVRMHDQRATCHSDADEIRWLATLNRTAPDAFMLLMLWRAEHGARSLRGETFYVRGRSMVRDKVLGDWGRNRYCAARDMLLERGLIFEVGMIDGEIHYRLADRVLTPSISARKRNLHKSAGAT